MREVSARFPLDRIRFYCFVLGCALLFWQYDAAPTDWLFGAGIVISALMWDRRLFGFDLEWPQPVLVVFLAVTAAVTALAGGSLRFFVITIYLALLTLALASTLRRDPARWRLIEQAIVLGAVITGVLVVAGALWDQIGVPALQALAFDKLRGKGLFKDPNVAGAFLACAYPLVAAVAARLPRFSLLALLAATAIVGAGVFFSFSRLAFGLFGLGLVGVIVAFAVQRRWSAVIGLTMTAVLTAGAVVAFGDLPLYRFRLIQPYDERGRFTAWVFAFEMVQESPLGIGSGSFERGFGQQMEQEFEKERERLAAQGAESDNLVRNGAMVSVEGWRLPADGGSALVADPTSPTGYALRKRSTAPYQDPVQAVPVVPSQPYSFAAQIRTDGTPALLIIHWVDGRGATIRQDGTPDIKAKEWTEAQVTNQIAPLFAKSALVFLSNRSAGEHYFTAVRAVPGTSVPPWSPAMQRAVPPIDVDFARDQTAAHNVYLRVAVESGLLGLGLLLAYLLILGWGAWTARDPQRWQWPLAFCLVLLAGVVIDTLHWRQLWLYAAVIAAWGREEILGGLRQAVARRPPLVPAGEHLNPGTHK